MHVQAISLMYTSARKTPGTTSFGHFGPRSAVSTDPPHGRSR
ncbi:hypothetical protein ACFRMQ_35550 [Kitasatospora sp. NPDC056783]